MKKAISTTILFLTCLMLYAQSPCERPRQHIMKSNRIAGYIYNDGSLFHDTTSLNGGFRFPYAGVSGPGVIAGAGLWIGGVDPGGNLKVAACSTEGGFGKSDFAPGPLDPELGTPRTDFPCEILNQIWVVTEDEIRAFIDDWKDNQSIDEEHKSIFAWPGNGNPYFPIKPLPQQEQGWAPFYDNDGDDIYDPTKGDFPATPYFGLNSRFIPKEMTWSVFHDNTSHVFSNETPIRIEVHQTTMVLECDSRPEVENTVFVDYKLINRAQEDIDTFYAGIAVDFEIGCWFDDYIGSIPSRNAFFAYNADAIDGHQLCSTGEWNYMDAPPAVSVKFMETHRTALLDNFTYFSSISMDTPTPRSTPENGPEIYNYLSGSWRDGTPLTFGGSGYDPLSTDYTSFAYPGNPNKQDEWSMLSTPMPQRDHTVLGTTGFSDPWAGSFSGLIQPSDYLQFTVAFTVHSDRDYDHISIVDKMIDDDLKNIEYAIYDVDAVNGPYCQNYHIEEPTPEPEEPFISGIYPNPTTGTFTIAVPETEIEEVEIYNTAWQLIYADKSPSEEVKEVDISNWANGIYFLKIKMDGHTLMRKVVKR